MVMSISKDSI